MQPTNFQLVSECRNKNSLSLNIYSIPGQGYIVGKFHTQSSVFDTEQEAIDYLNDLGYSTVEPSVKKIDLLMVRGLTEKSNCGVEKAKRALQVSNTYEDALELISCNKPPEDYRLFQKWIYVFQPWVR